MDNVQDILFGGFAPSSSAAELLSKALGSRTAMSGSVSRSKNDPSQSLQMIERPLLTTDELKALPRGDFVVMKTGVHPMRTHLKLFYQWGITFDEHKPYTVPERSNRRVAYAGKEALMDAICQKHPRPSAATVIDAPEDARKLKSLRRSKNPIPEEVNHNEQP